ncbi:hypothetical protein OPKNFCMD_3505 [Methylobacterium crusticola]|uniref:Response regulatory domain-containing protein n=1 Tax=Methylobacterium crusticola TaxID=1697972 RepID=A0ABQ4QZC0_9HYPH|nr:hypothetical protein [Methylobacterium crusticola]GJD50760.1 hypothetical protein OPKNFCMD_3505 [Methylobacterium crusticola]
MRLHLPDGTGPGHRRAAPEPTVPLLAVTSTTVLVVADEAGARPLTGEALQEVGYRVVAADGAAAALALLSAHPEIALLLNDSVRPEASGRKLADAALRRRPDLKGVFMTGSARNAVLDPGTLDPGTLDPGTLDPGTHLITRPSTLAQIALAVRTVMTESRDAGAGRDPA